MRVMCFPNTFADPAVLAGQYTRGRGTHAGTFLAFLAATTRRGAVRTLEGARYARFASGNASSTVSYLQFLQSIEKAIAVRTLESLARIELGAQGGALLERVTTTRTSTSLQFLQASTRAGAVRTLEHF